MIFGPSNALPLTPQISKADSALHEAARKLEAAFLAEMLKSSGLGQTGGAFGGGAGEDQFSSFMLQAQSEAWVSAG